MEVLVGSWLEPTIVRAIRLATEEGKLVQFEFNDVTISVMWDSSPQLILRDFSRADNGYIGADIGPYPKPRLSKEDLLGDKRIYDRKIRKYRKQEARRAAEAKAHRERIEALLVKAPEMEFSDKPRWETALTSLAQSLYGDGIAVYAERWARLMQLKLSEGESLAAVWDTTSQEADFEGQSGNSQAIATHLLTECWVHGAELRRLHNARWGVVNQGGTVNPAVWTVSPA